MTFDDYCNMCDEFEEYEFIAKDYFPTVEEIKILTRNLKKHEKYLVWLLETATDELKANNKDAYDYLDNYFKKYAFS